MDARHQTQARMRAAAAPFLRSAETIVAIVPAGGFGDQADSTWPRFRLARGQNYLVVVTDQRLLVLATSRTGFETTGAVTVDEALSGVTAPACRRGSLINRLDLTVSGIPRHLYVARPWSAELADVHAALSAGRTGRQDA